MVVKLYAALDWIGARTGWWLPMHERPAVEE